MVQHLQMNTQNGLIHSMLSDQQFRHFHTQLNVILKRDKELHH